MKYFVLINITLSNIDMNIAKIINLIKAMFVF